MADGESVGKEGVGLSGIHETPRRKPLDHRMDLVEHDVGFSGIFRRGLLNLP